MDTDRKDEFEIFSSLRIYIERVLKKILNIKGGRPYNYLESENELKAEHDQYYDGRDAYNQKLKEEK